MGQIISSPDLKKYFCIISFFACYSITRHFFSMQIYFVNQPILELGYGSM